MGYPLMLWPLWMSSPDFANSSSLHYPLTPVITWKTWPRMYTLTADEYASLAELAKAYREVHLAEIKQKQGWNPRLGVDALCFQRHGAESIVGALITPCELWLVVVPRQSSLTDPWADSLTLLLPSGTYRLALERLPGGYAIYKRAILQGLGELENMQEAARLAQQMMARLMQLADAPDA